MRAAHAFLSEALCEKVAVGVIAIPNTDYHAGHWLRCNEGVKELLARAHPLCARFLFWQPTATP